MPVSDDVAARAGSMLDKYQVPPFSVLDTRQGYWQEARRSWLALGIKSEIGRSAAAITVQRPEAPTYRTKGISVARASPLYDADMYRHRASGIGWGGPKDHVAVDKGDGFGMHNGGVAVAAPGEQATPVVSIFDPVLCELAYRWFCPPGGVILDPFAGGSVRGIIAAWLGHQYVGVDLSAGQIASNQEQALVIIGPEKPMPMWTLGDSRQVIPGFGEEWADFVFTCPPYHDLEVYSDDPVDLSAMEWPQFLDAYGDIIGHSLAALRRDRFAAIVVSEIRGPGGVYRGLVPWTIRQFEMHGARYYNEAILVNPAGTLPLRVGKQFDASRKLGRSHQNLLVFVKGEVPRTHDWGYERTGAPAPQLELFDIAGAGDDGRPIG